MASHKTISGFDITVGAGGIRFARKRTPSKFIIKLPIDTKEAMADRQLFRAIGSSYHAIKCPSVPCDFYAEFMRRIKEKGEDVSKEKSLEWARHFSAGDVFQAADWEHRQILLDVMITGSGSGTEPHVTRTDITRLCARLSEIGV